MAKKKDEKGERSFEDILSSIEKDFGKNSLMQFGKTEQLDIESVSTGSFMLDRAVGVGGLPRGRITEIFGNESSGKTTVCLSVVANAQKMKAGKVAYIDVENALDPSYCKLLGVDIDNMYISQPDCGEDALTIVQRLTESKMFAVIVVDSVSALVPRAEIEGEIGDSHMALQARLMSQSLRMLSKSVKTSNTCLIFINQVRMKIGVMFGSPTTTSGGNALKFYSSVRIKTARTGNIKRKDEVIGSTIKAQIIKNKVAPPFKEAEFEIWYDRGINRNLELMNMAIEKGIIEKSGSWFACGEVKIGQGQDSVLDKMTEDKEFFEMLKNKVFPTEEVK